MMTMTFLVVCWYSEAASESDEESRPAKVRQEKMLLLGNPIPIFPTQSQPNPNPYLVKVPNSKELIPERLDGRFLLPKSPSVPEIDRIIDILNKINFGVVEALNKIANKIPLVGPTGPPGPAGPKG